MSAPKPVRVSDSAADPIVAAFDNALPLDEPLSPEEVAALEDAMADPRPGISSDELLARLRPKK